MTLKHPYSGKNKKIGILGGTFNPVHSGHIHMAEATIKQLHLDRIVFMPAGVPPHKSMDFGTPTKDRLNMLKLAIKGRKNFCIDDYETQSKEKSYTYLSLNRIHKTLDKSSEIYFIIGADSLMRLNTWKNPEELFAICKFAVIPRGDYTKAQCERAIDELTQAYGGEIIYIDTAKVKMSSTAARGYDFEHMEKYLDDEVTEYIKRNGLYKKMTDTTKIKEYISKHLSKKRLAHVYGTVDAAERLAKIYDVDVEKAKLAALLHDCAKHMDNEEVLFLSEEYGFDIDETYRLQPELLHGAAGAYVAKNLFNVTDQEILDAITYHTVPRINMTKFDKIISVADLMEETRDYPHVEEIRRVAEDGLDAVFEKALERVIIHVVERNHLLHINSAIVYNNLLKSRKKSDKLKQTQGDK